MPVQIPGSYRAYCTDRAVRTAVDHILESKTLDVPADLEWDDLPKFHKAVLSAHQVRCEFAIFLHDLWDAVWQPTVDRSERKLTPKTVAETQDYWGRNPLDTYSVWEEGWFSRVFDIAGTMYALEIGAHVDVENRVRLALSLWDQENAKYTTNELGLGDCWLSEETEDDDGVHNYVYSKSEHAPTVDSGSIDLAPLHKAADDALAAIKCL